MRYLIIIFLFISGYYSFGQEKDLLQSKKYFAQELKQWENTFSCFKLSDFKAKDTTHFDNNFAQDFKSYKAFVSTYKPVITFSPDSSKFIDIYSYQLNLEKKEDYYYANPDVDQAVFLCYPKGKYWNRIFFGTSAEWIDEVVWISNTRFILVGITKSAEDRKKPQILLGNTEDQTLVRYICRNKSCVQRTAGYTSSKLKKIKMKGL